MKARKIGSSLRRVVPALPRVDGVILLTQDSSKVKRISSHAIRGVVFHTLSDWKTAVGFDAPRVLSSQQVLPPCPSFTSSKAAAKDGSLRRLAGYVNLEIQNPKEERFHRVYKGSHPSRRDRVVLHLYDMSAKR